MGELCIAIPTAAPAGEAVAYLDIGVGGYLDLGTEKDDDELFKLPPGRHMLGIIGTHGVDGYKAHQPAGGEAAARDREADRARFADAAFNNWLDEGISDSGHTVWDAVGDVSTAWSGWCAREFYATPPAAQVQQEADRG